ncbi:MAG: peptidase and chymotrypsin/Hap [Modestobacter sp.]|nr:peptidase and chymotrypsin/Hap [Modestobacter sp.]
MDDADARDGTAPDHRAGRGPAGRPRPGRAVITAVVGLLVLLTGCTGSDDGNSAAAPSSASGGTGTNAAGSEQAAYEQVIQKVLPSVVEIRSSSGLGSGVVYDTNGNVVTNAHVVGTDQQFEVLTSGSATPLPATLVGSYPPNDLAVIRVTGGRGLQPATFADSSQAEVGAIVLAMGNPLGLSATVTNGIVSATGRTVSEPATESSPGATLPDMLQTSAPINPGNSGGALVDLQGRVLGIPTLAANGPQGGAAPGIGFAIPASQVTRIADQLVRSGTVTDSGRAALGIQVTTVVDQSGAPKGVAVVAVTSGGPAATAGIQPGDVIVAVNGQRTPTAQALGAVLADLTPGQAVPVTVVRGTGQQDVQVTLGEL